MKKLSIKEFDEIRRWVHINAREIELAIWRYHFENGSKEEVLSALFTIKTKMEALVIHSSLIAGILIPRHIPHCMH